MHNDYRPTTTDWISMLSISTRLIFPKVREHVINKLTSRLESIDPFDLIGLAIKYDVQQWLKPTYHRIVRRTELITHAEAGKIPFPIAVMLMRSHEQCSVGKVQHIDHGVQAIVRMEVGLMEKSCA
jgi:hypothetical protein